MVDQVILSPHLNNNVCRSFTKSNEALMRAPSSLLALEILSPGEETKKQKQ